MVKMRLEDRKNLKKMKLDITLLALYTPECQHPFLISHYEMKKFAKTPSAPFVPAKVFKIVVREDAHEVGLVVAYPVSEKQDQVIVRGELKKFPNEKAKLKFLANAEQRGFRNFETSTGKFDMESEVLEELVRRRKIERELKDSLLPESLPPASAFA